MERKATTPKDAVEVTIYCTGAVLFGIQGETLRQTVASLWWIPGCTNSNNESEHCCSFVPSKPGGRVSTHAIGPQVRELQCRDVRDRVARPDLGGEQSWLVLLSSFTRTRFITIQLAM